MFLELAQRSTAAWFLYRIEETRKLWLFSAFGAEALRSQQK